MTAAIGIINQALIDGVRLVLSATGSLKAIGNQRLLDRWLPIIRANKQEIVHALSNDVNESMASTMEFAGDDDRLYEDATKQAAFAVPNRSPSEWLGMIAELDRLIREFCALSDLSSDALARIMDTRFKQSLFSIPATLVWFRVEINRLRSVNNEKR